jgi:hypothetical protein
MGGHHLDDARAGPGHHEHAGRRGQHRRPAPAPAAAPRPGLAVVAAPGPADLASQSERDILDGHPAGRLRGDTPQHVR